MTSTMRPRRGEIWLVNFDPSIGAEQQKVRPAVVVSLDAIGRLPLRIVVPITDWKDAYTAYPWFVQLHVSATNGLSKESGADAFQIKSLAEARFVRRLGRITDQQLAQIIAAVRLCIGA